MIAKFDKGEVSVPTGKVFKACCERFETYSVDEFRTTRVHHKTDAVRGLLWCSSTNKYGGKLINRDLNGALNIRRCLLLPARPASLDRKHCRGNKLSDRIGKLIRQ